MRTHWGVHSGPGREDHRKSMRATNICHVRMLLTLDAWDLGRECVGVRRGDSVCVNLSGRSRWWGHPRVIGTMRLEGKWATLPSSIFLIIVPILLDNGGY